MLFRSDGKVIIAGKSIYDMKDKELTKFRRQKIGFIFQSYNLIPTLSVYENIILPMVLDNRKTDSDYLKLIVKTLGIEEKLQSKPLNLSGGQQQRVAIARALISKPAIILADEPTGNLDSKTSKDVLELLKTTSKQLKQTIIMITHDETIAHMADRIIRIEDGGIK